MSDEPTPSVCDICGKPREGSEPIIEALDGAAWAHASCFDTPKGEAA